jgi:SAM-dependent methyltransferase
MKEHFKRAFTALAQAYWTEERTHKLNGDKSLVVLPGTAPILLRAMGLLNKDASLPPTKVRKYRQINHMVRVLQPALTEICSRFDTVRILDAGCGRSYLTMLLAWWFAEHQRHPVSILGVDRSQALVEECRRRADRADLEGLRFEASQLADLRLEEPPHVVISLHACDTATDDAITLGVQTKADFIAVAPCCQAELSKKWESVAGGAFAPMRSVPHFRRTAASTTTDIFRVVLLRAAGYDTDAVEFVDGNHTAKNTLIRALRVGDENPAARAESRSLVEATGGEGIALADRILKS